MRIKGPHKNRPHRTHSSDQVVAKLKHKPYFVITRYLSETLFFVPFFVEDWY